jgi:hypothetical protein
MAQWLATNSNPGMLPYACGHIIDEFEMRNCQWAVGVESTELFQHERSNMFKDDATDLRFVASIQQSSLDKQ